MLLSSCVVIKNEDYPENWPSPAEKPENVLRSIEGSYNNFGKNSSGKGSNALNSYFFEPNSGLFNTKVIKIIPTSEETIEIEAWSNDSFIKKIELQKGKDFKVSSKGIVISKSESTAEGPIGAGSVKYVFSTAKDQSLIVKSKFFGVGIYVIPYSAHMSEWERFEIAERNLTN